MKHEGGTRTYFLIRRLKCNHCKKLHRELPDCLVPHKHYSAEVISGALEGVLTPQDAETEDYPCEMTLQRWHVWMVLNTDRINGYLKSIGYQLLGFGEELLKSGTSLLHRLRSSSQRWLETIMRYIYNSGGCLATS